MSNLSAVFDNNICRITLLDKTISFEMLCRLNEILDRCENEVSAVVIEGGERIFCIGADFQSVSEESSAEYVQNQTARLLYTVFRKLAEGAYVSIACVKGQTAAGGMGFVGACNIAVADENATFVLSEMLFGMIPACVYPFLAEKMGAANTDAMALTAIPISAAQAHAYGLVRLCSSDTEKALNTILNRVCHFDKKAIREYKSYTGKMKLYSRYEELAVSENQRMFCDPNIISSIVRYNKYKLFPWQK